MTNLTKENLSRTTLNASKRSRRAVWVVYRPDCNNFICSRHFTEAAAYAKRSSDLKAQRRIPGMQSSGTFECIGLFVDGRVDE